MAKLKVSSSASGTGTVTLIAPATSTDRTITLPDESITLGGGVDGIVSTANATAITIDSSENVGIGTGTISFPSGTGLEVYDASVPRIKLANSTTGNTSSDGFDMHISGSDVKFWQRENAAMAFATNGTERLEITSDGRGLSQFTAKAWVNFDGTVAAASMIRDSHNVSSITDNGTGDYSVNFTNAMANANYAANVATNVQSGTYHSTCGIISNATGSCRITSIHNTANSAQDKSLFTLSVFGD